MFLPRLWIQIKLYFIYSHNNGIRPHVLPWHKLLLQRSSIMYFWEFSQYTASRDTRTRWSDCLTQVSFWPPACRAYCWGQLRIMSSAGQSDMYRWCHFCLFPTSDGVQRSVLTTLSCCPRCWLLEINPCTALLGLLRSTSLLTCHWLRVKTHCLCSLTPASTWPGEWHTRNGVMAHQESSRAFPLFEFCEG